MMVKDIKGRVFKTGLKIDYTPKRVKLENSSLDGKDVDILACGK